MHYSWPKPALERIKQVITPFHSEQINICCPVVFLYIALHILQFLNPVVQNTYKNTIYFTLERGTQSLFILQNARTGQ